MAGVVKISDSLELTYGREMVGKVVSDAMNKTIVVSVTRMYRHPKYGKTVAKEKRYKVHDENGVARVGDVVRIGETRRLSKTKHMVLIEVVEKARTA